LTVVEDVNEVSTRRIQEPKVRRSRRPKLSQDEVRELARLYADTSTSTSEICARLGIGESTLYRVVQSQGIPVRGRGASVTTPGIQPARVTTVRTERPRGAGRQRAVPSGQAASSGNGSAGAGAMTGKRGRPARAPSVAPSSRRQGAGRSQVTRISSRFRVQYQVERVFEALTLQDALRQAESLGATEITGVTRED
jgi:transposase-like protein